MRGSIYSAKGIGQIVIGPGGPVGEVRNLWVNGVLVVDGAGNITLEGRAMGFHYILKPSADAPTLQ